MEWYQVFGVFCFREICSYKDVFYLTQSLSRKGRQVGNALWHHLCSHEPFQGLQVNVDGVVS